MVARLVVATAVLVPSALFIASAQTPRGAEPADAAIAALVTELRAIRGDLADATQRSLRFQLLLARLQLQEQRIGHLDRQRADITKSLMDTHAMASMFASQSQLLDRGCEGSVPPEEREACEAQLTTLKATMATHQAREQQLRLQEQELLQAIGTEQGRWSDFSSRLDELERTLARPR
jgi:hypothetical protein